MNRPTDALENIGTALTLPGDELPPRDENQLEWHLWQAVIGGVAEAVEQQVEPAQIDFWARYRNQCERGKWAEA